MNLHVALLIPTLGLWFLYPAKNLWVVQGKLFHEGLIFRAEVLFVGAILEIVDNLRCVEGR